MKGGFKTTINPISKQRKQYYKSSIDPRILYDKLGIKYQLKGNRLWSLCPNKEHKDSVPSFVTNIDQGDKYGLFYCFGCGWSGDVYSLLISLDIVPDFVGAYNWLKDNFGVGSYKVTTNELYSTNWLNNNNTNNIRSLLLPEHFKTKGELKYWPNMFREYLENRNVTDNMVRKYNIGWIPPKSVCDWEICPCGRKKESKYCYFSGRVIIPVVTQNKIVDFQARAVKKSVVPKTMKACPSPSVSLFGHQYINYFLDYVIIVEGPFDVLALDTLGVPNSVALLNSRVLTQHKPLLEPFKNWVILPDKDGGPNKNQLNTFMVNSILPDRYSHRVYMGDVPVGCDVAQLYEDGRGDELVNIIKNAQPYKIVSNRPNVKELY